MSPRPKRGNTTSDNTEVGNGETDTEDREDKKKIISVTMSQSIVSQIDQLVRERVARSRAQLIEDAVRWFIDLTVHKWSDRGIYVNGCRVAMETDAHSSLFFSTMTPASQYELGKTAGSQTPVLDMMTLAYRIDPHSPKGRTAVLNLLQSLGWGAIEAKEEDIIIGSPFYPAPFIQGFLESLMKIRLQPLETHARDKIAFRIVG